MDKKISIRLREEEYDEITKCAEEKGKKLSEYIRSRVLAKPEQVKLEGTNKVRIQLLKIKAYLHYIALEHPRLEIDFQPVDDIMEVIWDELY